MISVRELIKKRLHLHFAFVCSLGIIEIISIDDELS